MSQSDLFHGEHLPPRLRYQALFEFLPRIAEAYVFGRPHLSRNAMLRAFIYRCLRRLPTLSDLNYSLRENPSLAEAIGLDPFAAAPSIERFSCWLRDTPHETLQSVRLALIRGLVQSGVVRGATVSFDTTPVVARVKQNNLKTTLADRFNKHRYAQADPEARLGAYRVYPGSGTQTVRFFWGYRNHAVVDFDTELPLWEETHPANHHELRSAIPLLQACRQQLQLPIEVVCGDSAYDAEAVLAFIIEQLHAKPVIAANARFQPHPEFRLQGKVVLCPARLEMTRKGRMTPKKTAITYQQYCCPLHYRQSIRQQYLLCPANHPKFLSQKGCNYLVRETPSYRSQIPYGSAEFEAAYRKRSSVERTFARLLALSMQQPTVHGLAATRNHCTITHIAVLLVATAAHATGHSDKLAFVRTIVADFVAET